MTHATRFMGIDAGGSKTVCLLGDERQLIGRGEAGPANPAVVGTGGFTAAVTEAARRAGAEGVTVARAWIGAAGSERPVLRRELEAAAREALGVNDVHVSHDGRLLLAAAGLDAGIAVVAGTGSSAFGLARDGRQSATGGWGHLLGDEGSGYAIARAAMAAATRAADGRGPRTALLDALLEAAGATEPGELRERCYPAPAVPETARFAASVLDLARVGDTVASTIVRDAGAALAAMVDAVAQRLETGEPLPIVAAGGLLAQESPLLAAMRQALRAIGRTNQVIPVPAEPAAGALALAREPPGARETAAGNENGVVEGADAVHKGIGPVSAASGGDR